LDFLSFLTGFFYRFFVRFLFNPFLLFCFEMGLSIYAQYGLILHKNVVNFLCTISLDKKQTFSVVFL